MIRSDNIHLWLFTLVSLWLVSPGFASAQTCDNVMINDAPNALWFVDANWSLGRPPTADEVACYPNGEGVAERAAAGTAGNAANSTSSVPGDPSAACCVGSACQLATRSNCEAAGGFFADGVAFCSPGLCVTGACCTGAPACVDDNGNGGSMTESICGIIGGTYFGAAGCEFGDLCGLQRLPEGFEIIRVAPDSIGDARHHPKINNCGQVTVSIASDDSPLGPAAEIYVYDNGAITRITDNAVSDLTPDINDDGTIVWSRGLVDTGTPGDVVLLRDGQEAVIGSGSGFNAISHAGHAVWHRFDTDLTFLLESTVMFYDGSVERGVYHDGFSNQSVRINERDDIAWRQVIVSAPNSSGFTADIRLLTDGVLEIFQTGAPDSPAIPALDNIGRLAWSTYTDHRVIDLHENGQTTTILDGNSPALNNRGDIAHSFKTTFTPWQIWLLRDGELFWISSIQDKADLIDNVVPDMNDAGEITWWRVPNGAITPGDTMLMRRIRTGDVDLDNDVDELDLAYFPECFTGPTPTDGLCVCRFLDIDHDRDVDSDDFTLFMANYTGGINDCNGNGTPDTDDIFGGAVPDCNKNGVPDSCDIATGFSADVDGDGLPDDCVCRNLDRPWKPVLYQRRGRYLSIIPRNEGKQIAMRVSFLDVPGFPEFAGQTRWVGPVGEFPEEDSSDPTRTMFAANLQCEPYYDDFGRFGVVHVYGGDITPDARVHVQTIGTSCGNNLSREANYTPALEARTATFGDVARPLAYEPGDPGIQPDFKDINALVLKFLGDPAAPIKAIAQLMPNVVFPDRSISFRDISAGVSGFLGVSYAGAPGITGPCPCPSTVPCGATACQVDADCTPGFCISGFCMDECGRCSP